ncbi:MAG: NUDIX hydrolase [Magnetococcales bacterium]|nr:NUDIX hydrolase [Magnetococcales bacterium]
MKVKVHKIEDCHKGFFQLQQIELEYERFDGTMNPPMSFECLERGEAVAIILYDPENDYVGLIRQFRIGAHMADGQGWCVEIVAGACDGESDHQAVAQREIEEETGLKIQKIQPLFDYFISPSGTTERIHLYMAHYDSQQVINGGGGLAHEGEDIQFFHLPFDDAWQMVRAGDINSATAIMAMQWLKLERNGLI